MGSGGGGGGKGGRIEDPSVPMQFMPVFNEMQRMFRGGRQTAEEARNMINPYSLGMTTQAGQTPLSGQQAFESILYGPQGRQAAYDLFGAGTQGMREGAATGFLDDAIGDLDRLLRPALVDRPYAQGSADIREARALTGTARASGAVDETLDLRTNLEQNFGAAMAPLIGEASQTAQQIRAGMSPQAAGFPGQLYGMSQQRIGDILNTGLQREGMEFQAANALANIQNGLPVVQPGYGQGKGSSMGSIIGIAAPIVGAAVGGPAGYAVGSAIGSAASG